MSEGKVLIYPDCDRPSKIAIIKRKFYQWISRELIGQVDFLSTFPKDKIENFLISTPASACLEVDNRYRAFSLFRAIQIEAVRGCSHYYVTLKLAIFDPPSPLCNGFGRNSD